MSVAALNVASWLWTPALAGFAGRSYHRAPVASRGKSVGEITLLLAAVREGDRSALDTVFDRLYSELKRLARSQLRYGRTAISLDTTALVHEAYLKLVRAETLSLVDRGHFFALAAKAMRRPPATLSTAQRSGGVEAPLDGSRLRAMAYEHRARSIRRSSSSSAWLLDWPASSSCASSSA
jgi:hypothetical protein